jgi:competence ComEA-like helix-hairpin-helix protein
MKRIWVVAMALAVQFSACGKEKHTLSPRPSETPNTAHAAHASRVAEAAPLASAPQAESAEPREETKFTCSMHPEVISDKPGKCPKCGMNLVPAAGVDADAGQEVDAFDEKGNLVNVNTATLAELDAVNGIGRATATKIIEYREKNGPLRSADDLKAAGIHGCVLGKIKDQLSFAGGSSLTTGASTARSTEATSGAHTGAHAATAHTTSSSPAGSSTRANINTATAAQIKAAVPRMSQATADAIVAARQTAGSKFTNWSSIDAVPGVGEVTIEKLKLAFDLK